MGCPRPLRQKQSRSFFTLLVFQNPSFPDYFFLSVYEGVSQLNRELFLINEFQALKQQSTRYKTEKTFSTAEGENEINIRKNRYKDILPCKYIVPSFLSHGI